AMSAAVQTVPEEPRVLRALPGRVRVHLPEWSGQGEHALEARLRQIPGVRSAQANPLTRNVLIGFDPAATDQQRVLDAVRAAEPPAGDARAGATRPALPSARPSVLRERRDHRGRARIAVPGLEGNPALARQLVERLQQQPGVRRVAASALTSRLLVEYDSHQTDLEDFLAEITGMELPDLPGQDQPSHPLDPAPLIQSATRTVGAGLGLGLLASRRLLGVTSPPAGGATAAQVAGIIGIVQGFPITRNGLRRLLGRDTADILFQGAAIVSLALSGSPLGLSVTGAEALRLLTEVVARRRAWKRYEERLGDAAAAHPGAVIRLEAGERCPLAGQVIEGTGTAIGRDGRLAPLAPGSDIGAGSRVHGGPFVVGLQGGAPFAPEQRDVPATPSLYDRYVQALGPASLAYAVLTAVVTRSFGRAFAALLLVTPRTSVIATEGANTGASARVLRAGVTVVGTRPHRVVRRPDLLLIDGPRVLTEGHEIAGTLPVGEEGDPAELLGYAAGVAAAAGAPWGGAFPAGDRVEASDGTFDGRVAAATIGGERYTLGPATDHDAVPAALRLRHRGETLLALRRAGEPRPRALFALRPRLARDVADLVATARRRGVALALIRHGDAATAQAVARRAGMQLLDGDPVALIRARQDEGALVAFLSDSAASGAAFAACDLAIGLSSGRSGRFPARADLLAPDLGAVAAVVETGARREAAVRDGVLLSLAANVAGAVWGFRGAPGVEAASRFVYVTALGALADNWLRLRGGERPRDALTRLADPRPERWGRRDVAG
ncbi:MAG TPA: hypothetical protein VFL91_16600, partial [Thermomicrobiales bacterium]|nr:hypothetical protein [Thermomicrobiales bacterium]